MNIRETKDFLEGKLAARDEKDPEARLTSLLEADDRVREAERTYFQLKKLIFLAHEDELEPTPTLLSILTTAQTECMADVECERASHYYRQGLESGLVERISDQYDYDAVKVEYAATICQLAGELVHDHNLTTAHRQTLKEAAHAISRIADGLIE